MAGISDELRAEVRAWIAGDPDPVTRAELEALLEAGAGEELASPFAGDLGFGTAGLRGAVAAGPRRMNRAVVIRATRGLADHLLDTVGPGRVVVAHDARPDSPRFAADTVGVLLAAGFDVTWFREPTPTPVAAWLCRELDAVGGVVVTASHNPPADNGYKVFGAGGIQITSPTDVQVAAAIARVGPAAEVPRAEGEELARATAPDTAWVRTTWFDRLAAARPVKQGTASVSIVVTPMHGVGGAWLEAALVDAGHAAPIRVASQWEPDGTFPTVSFPNPEEPGALDEAFAVARTHDADVVLALDPDADRLAVAIPDGDTWRRLTGDELGCLLADHLLRRLDVPRPVVASSIVSSRRLERIAARHEAEVVMTLTGFKWIWRALAAKTADGATAVLGYEEAIGYSVGDVVRDKDGIGAGVVVADLVAGLAAEGLGLADALSDLDARVGAWTNRQVSVRLEGEEGASRIDAAMTTARTAPADVAGVAVVEVEDLASGEESRPPWLPADDVVIWHLDGGGRVLIRPSGTEPKLKVYVDVPVEADVDGAALTERIGQACVVHLGLA